MLSKSRAEKRQTREPKLTDGEVFMPDDMSLPESTSTWGVVNVDSSDGTDPMEELRVPSSKLPWAISECDHPPFDSYFLQSLSLREWWPHDKLHCTVC